MSASGVPHPTVMWAQRPKLIFLTVCLSDCQNPDIKVEKDRLTFRAVGGTDKKEHAVDMEFFKEIDTEKSKYAVRDRVVEFALEKAEEGPYWERLLKDKTKQHWLKIDFNKWKDEDDSDDEAGGGGGPGGGADLEEMGFNSLLEGMRGAGMADPMEEMARQNEAIKEAVSQERRDKQQQQRQQPQQQQQQKQQIEPPQEKKQLQQPQEQRQIVADPSDVTLVVEDDPASAAELVTGSGVNDDGGGVLTDSLAAKLKLYELQQRNKKLAEHLARKELVLAAKQAFLAENHLIE